jgi:hypothetical protein
MFHVIGIILTFVLLSGYLVPVQAFGKGKAQPQRTFTTAEEAASALASAYKSADSKALVEILGPKGQRLVSSGDPVLDRIERDWFISLYEEGHETVTYVSNIYKYYIAYKLVTEEMEDRQKAKEKMKKGSGTK